MPQTFSFISVGELISPVVGGILYKKAGIPGVFGLSGAMLVLDFLMRVLIVEKRFAKGKYSAFLPAEENSSDPEEPSEEDPLIPQDETEKDYKIDEDYEPGRLIKAMPFLYCFRNPRLFIALFLGFVQASIVGIFDATIPTEAQTLFDFTSLEAGLLYIALDVPYLVLCPVPGWAVAKHPVRAVANGRPAFTLYATTWSDDVSGNISKQYNAHTNMYLANLNLPHEKLQQEFFVRFHSTSQHASSSEQFCALTKDMFVQLHQTQ